MMAHCGDGIESDNNSRLFITPYFFTVYYSLTPKPLRIIKSSSSYLRCVCCFDDFREPGVVRLLSFLADYIIENLLCLMQICNLTECRPKMVQ